MKSVLRRPSPTAWGATFPLRLCLYGFLTFVLFQSVLAGVRSQGAATMGNENGPIELTQLALALIGSLAYFYASYRSAICRFGLILGGAVIGYAAARESDLWFESMFFDDAYKWLVGVPMLALVLTVGWIQRRRVLPESWQLMQQPSGTLFAVAGIYLMAVCQPLDRPAFWSSITDPAEVVVTKALFEEYAELFAYLLLAISGTEAAIASIRKEPAAVVLSRSDKSESEFTANTPRQAA